MRQVDAVSKGGRGRKGGHREAARQLGISEVDVRRAVKVASLSEEAQAAARELGLDNNRTALLKAAEADTPEAQVRILREIASQRKPRQLDAVSRARTLIDMWHKASPEVQDIVYRALLPEWAELARNDKRTIEE